MTHYGSCVLDEHHDRLCPLTRPEEAGVNPEEVECWQCDYWRAEDENGNPLDDGRSFVY